MAAKLPSAVNEATAFSSLALGNDGFLYAPPLSASYIKRVDPGYATATVTFTAAGNYKVCYKAHGSDYVEVPPVAGIIRYTKSGQHGCSNAGTIPQTLTLIVTIP